MNDGDLIGQVYHKIEREKALINAANAMRQSSNPQVQHSLDAQIREGRKNIGYLEERMRELQMRRMGQGMENMTVGSSGNGSPMPLAHGSQGAPPQNPRSHIASSQQQARGGYMQDQGGYGDPGSGGYRDQMGSDTGIMPPRPPFSPSAPGSAMPKARPNYSKLGTSIFSRF